MGDTTKIQWTDATWNCVRGCSRTSPGCGGPNHEGGCYAERIAARFSDSGQPFHGFAERTPHGGRWTGKVGLVEEFLTLPLRWRKPRRIFVNSMSDLFHEALSDEVIDKVFAVMALAQQHTFQVLTKRADRMRGYMTDRRPYSVDQQCDLVVAHHLRHTKGADYERPWPLSNVWLGVSVEDRARKTRIDDLRATPAAVRFLSAEPLLEDLGALNLDGIHQVIIGGESGPRSRPFHLSWATLIIDQCKGAGVACFMKQLGARAYEDRAHPDRMWRYHTADAKGGKMEEWPAELRVREFPPALAA